MIISNLVVKNEVLPPVPERARPPASNYPRVGGRSTWTKAKRHVDEDSAKKIATAYSCANTISDDIGMMPLQQFNSFRGQITRLYPDAVARNTAYLLEKQPNRWMVPFIWKKTIINWLLWWGNAYIWDPPSRYRELFILDASRTYPVFDEGGNKWYATIFPDQSQQLIPDVEMAHLMINSKDGLSGMSVLEYARETMGRQLAAHETQDEISGHGLLPAAAVSVDSKGQQLTQESRDTLRKSYIDAVEDGVAIFDDIIKSLDPITMKPTDAQFLEGIAATDADIANFFKFPLHRLNMGKQSYESNEQQDLNYVKSCLNPPLIQIEQVGGIKWIAEADQPFQYLKFNRDSILQTDAKTRTDILKTRIQSGMMTPNEALQIEDSNGYLGGGGHYMPANLGTIQADGSILGGSPAAVNPPA